MMLYIIFYLCVTRLDRFSNFQLSAPRAWHGFLARVIIIIFSIPASHAEGQYSSLSPSRQNCILLIRELARLQRVINDRCATASLFRAYPEVQKNGKRRDSGERGKGRRDKCIHRENMPVRDHRARTGQNNIVGLCTATRELRLFNITP